MLQSLRRYWIFALVHLLASLRFQAEAFSMARKPSNLKKITTCKRELNSGGRNPLEPKPPSVSSRLHTVTVRGLPTWLPSGRLLGNGDWKHQEFNSNSDKAVSSSKNNDISACQTLTLRASLPLPDACALAARLRGVGIGGNLLEFDATPPLPRAAVRAARTEDARARRNTSPGFKKSGVELDAEGKW